MKANVIFIEEGALLSTAWLCVSGNGGRRGGGVAKLFDLITDLIVIMVQSSESPKLINWLFKGTIKVVIKWLNP